MSRLFRILPLAGCAVALCALLGSSTMLAGAPVKLALKFRAGQTLRYTYQESLSYTPPAKFTDLSGYKLETKVDFAMLVNNVSEEGVAAVRLTFDRITVQLDGTQVADLTVFPKKGDQISATIKPNGEATFYKHIYLTMNNGGQLEFRVARDGGIIATKTLSKRGSEKIEYAADLDEDHGVIRDGVPPTCTLASPEHGKLVEFKVDLLPVKLFDFVNLPTVALAEGQFFSLPIKYVGHEKLTYQGQADIAGYQGYLVQAEVTPWTDIDPSDSSSGFQPEAKGDVSYIIDPTGKLIQGKAQLNFEISIPEIGPQTATSKIELIMRR